MSKYKELVKKLKEIFQIDRPELDFGIYRILNVKGDEINGYLENTLKKKISDALATAGNANKEELEAKLDKIIKTYQELEEDPFEKPKVKDLQSQISALSQGVNEHENAVYTHMLSFFSRYYDSGDFVSKRRYKGDTYAIPYAGEEVMLHWANKDQYYIKSGENFANYSFKLKDGRKVSFKLLAADTAKASRKDNDADRKFVLIEPHFRTKFDDEDNEHEEEYLPISLIKSGNIEELVIQFEYIALKKGTKQEPLVEQAIKTVLASEEVKNNWVDITSRKPTEKNPNRTLLEKHLTTYTQRNTADYFIHKNLGGFLSNELDFYIKNEVMNLDNVQNAKVFADIEKQLRMIQCFRSISKDIIAFLAQLENFQKKLWVKKKFVVQTDYCVTINKLDEALYPEILNNTNQLDEWRSLFNVNILSVDDLRVQPFLVLDTKFFNVEFKSALLNSLDNFDDGIDGILINSENFDALNLFKERYREKIKSIYIDPPYNTGNDGFAYKDHYQESSWLTLMENRLALAKSFLRADAAMFISIDDRELYNLKKLTEQIYSDFASKNIAIKMSEPTGKKMASVIKTGSVAKLKEYGLILKKDKISGFDFERISKGKWDDEYKTLLLNITKEEVEYIKKVRDDEDFQTTTLNKVDSILGKIEFVTLSSYAKEEEIKIDDNWKYQNSWRIVQIASLSGVAKRLSDEKRELTDANVFYVITPQNKLYLIKSDYDLSVSTPRVKLLFADDYLTLHCGDFWADIKTTGLDNEGYIEFLNGKKPLKLLKRFLTSTIKNNDIVFDFFAGSGSTGQAVFQINKEKETQNKFILCEQNAYFEDKLKIRLLKTQYIEKHTSILKYIKLEGYEDSLNNLEIKKPQQQLKLLDELSEDAKSDYLLNYMLEKESKGSLLSTDDFKKPFNYKMMISVDSAGAREEKNIDLVETFNYLIGLHVNSIESNVERGYVRIEGKLPSGERALVLWRDCEKIQYDDFTKFASRFDLFAKQKTFDVIYVNGDHNLPTAFTNDDGEVTRTLKLRQIEPEFLELMFAPDDLV
jgi:adenine-specific DNA-methyltransferase